MASLWRLEVANSLQSAVRRQRISKEFCDAALTDLSLLNIMLDPDTDTFAWSATLRLAERCGPPSTMPLIWNWPNILSFPWPRSISSCVPPQANSVSPY
jgi:hypothetical protein